MLKSTLIENLIIRKTTTILKSFIKKGMDND
jgi:hypothetical protein